MKLHLYQIDAFAEKPFTGNPAAVCPLKEWLPDALMQDIAAENNLSETAFCVEKDGGYEIRWFTPENEVALCGHATLATAHVIFEVLGHQGNDIWFLSPRSGKLSVAKTDNGLLTLDFPADKTVAVPRMPDLEKAIGRAPTEILKGKTDYLLVYPSQKDIERISPNFHLLAQCDCRGIMVSAPGDGADFVSRFFAPACGIPEDPVTGSAHTTMIPYWANVLGKTKMMAKQLSKRGGHLHCEHLGDRVKIGGRAVLYLQGEITVNT